MATALTGAVFCGLAAFSLVQWGWSEPSPTSGAATAEEVLWRGMVWAAAALCGWLGLGSVLVAGATVPGAVGSAFEQLARWLTPRVLRRGLAMALGTAVATVTLPTGTATGLSPDHTAHTTGLGTSVSSVSPHPFSGGTSGRAAPAPSLAPTLAGTSGPTSPRAVGTAASVAPDPSFAPTDGRAAGAGAPVAAGTTAGGRLRAAPDPGWQPSPPVRLVDAGESVLLAPLPRTGTAADEAVTVRRGDTLWHLAARHLGPGASDAEIALEWPRWYAANRQVIGADPDRLVPGQQLQPPTDGGH